MLAPTRELVAELNRRARDHRLNQSPTASEVRLAETLQQILGRDEAPVSASTVLRELTTPAARLFQGGSQ
jgi:hypothetical protein